MMDQPAFTRHETRWAMRRLLLLRELHTGLEYPGGLCRLFEREEVDQPQGRRVVLNRTTNEESVMRGGRRAEQVT